MADAIDLAAQVRAGTGKGAARQARRDGHVPGIVYGGDAPPLPINLDFNPLLTRLRAGHFLSTLWNLKVEGRPDQRVVCQAVQRHVVKDVPVHVDFRRVTPTSRVKLRIEVRFENHDASPGLKRGGTLVVVRQEVELEVTAGDIPDHLTVDLAGTDVGTVIHIDDIALPAGARKTVDRNFVVANVSAPSGLRASDAVDGAEAAAAT